MQSLRSGLAISPSTTAMALGLPKTALICCYHINGHPSRCGVSPLLTVSWSGRERLHYWTEISRLTGCITSRILPVGRCVLPLPPQFPKRCERTKLPARCFFRPTPRLPHPLIMNSLFFTNIHFRSSALRAADQSRSTGSAGSTGRIYWIYWIY